MSAVRYERKWLAEEVARALPCAFCQSIPEVGCQYIETGSGDGAPLFWIRCMNHLHMNIEASKMGVHGYAREDDPPSDRDARETVLAHWNARKTARRGGAA